MREVTWQQFGMLLGMMALLALQKTVQAQLGQPYCLEVAPYCGRTIWHYNVTKACCAGAQNALF